MSNLSNAAWQHVYFKPWIGKNYAEQEFKIMNLTESHYVWNDDHCYKAGKCLLCNTILDHISGDYPVRTYNKAKAAVTGNYHSDNHNFFDCTVMHTYFQDFVGHIDNCGHRDKSFLKANEKVFIDKAKNALFELMNHLKKENIYPDLIIVWGSGWGKYSMHQWLPQDDNNKGYAWGTAINQSLGLWQYNAFPETFFWFMMHPSCAGFSYDKYHNEYKNVRACLSKYHGKVPFNPQQFI